MTRKEALHKMVDGEMTTAPGLSVYRLVDGILEFYSEDNKGWVRAVRELSLCGLWEIVPKCSLCGGKQRYRNSDTGEEYDCLQCDGTGIDPEKEGVWHCLNCGGSHPATQQICRQPRQPGEFPGYEVWEVGIGHPTSPSLLEFGGYHPISGRAIALRELEDRPEYAGYVFLENGKRVVKGQTIMWRDPKTGFLCAAPGKFGKEEVRLVGVLMRKEA